MIVRKAQSRKHSQTYNTGGATRRGRVFRLLLSLFLLTLLVPQVPLYAIDPPLADTAASAAATDTSATEGPLPTPEETPSAAPLESTDEANGENPVGNAEGAERATAVESEATQSGGAFATLAEAEDAGAISGVPDDSEAYIENEVIVILAGEDSAARELATVEESLSVLSDTDDAVEAQLLAPASPDSSDGSTALVELPIDVSVRDALLELANDDHVAFAQPNYRYTLLDDDAFGEGQTSTSENQSALEPLYKPNDPKANDLSTYGQWWLETVKAFQAWDRQKVERAVKVAVIDTGVRLTHKDLADNIDKNLAWDAYRGQLLSTSVSKGQIGNQGDVSNHGTLVSGVIAAEADNGVLGAGVSFNAKIVPINIFYIKNGGTTADTSTVIKAFNYIINDCAKANIRVVNMSFGGYSEDDDDRALHQKIQDAKSLGILSVAAAGNGNTSATCYPSDYDEVVSVTAVEQNLSRWVSSSTQGSDYNEHKDLAAPGSIIYTTTSSGDTDTSYGTGTSLATPVVSGIAALLFAKNPSLTPDQVKDILCKTATDLGAEGPDIYYGSGLVNADAALAAVPVSHTVTFNPNGGTAEFTTTIKNHDSVIGTLPTASRTGYAFAGWFTAESGGTQITSATKVLDTVTYYAHWNINSYTATFNSNGGNAPSFSSITRPYNTEFGSLPTAARTGHTFAGWFTAESGGTQITANTRLTAHITYYAHWNINSYTATFNSNGGSTASPPTITRPYNTELGSLPTATYTGYTFAGWFTAASGGTQITSATKITGNITYHAHWTIGRYTATFDSNGGSTASPSTITKNYNTYIGSLPTSTRTGYTFVGWFTAATGGTQISTTQVLTASVTYYAHWEINTYVVSFNALGGSPAPANVTKPYDSAIGALPAPTHTGYTLAGWFTAASGGAQITSATKVTANVTYYAHWTINSYTVSFNSNGGSTALPANTITKTYNTSIGTLPTSTRTGHTFAGWFTTATGGAQITTTTKVMANVTYYAHWTAVTYKATFNSNGGDAVSPASVSQPYNTNIGTLPVTTRSGYAFDGWYTAATGGTKIATTTKITASVTYYAHWAATNLDNAVVTISSTLSSSRVFDVSAGSISNGARIQIYQQNTTPAQRFRLERVSGTNYYVIKNINSGKVIDVSGAKTANGTAIQQYSQNNTPAQSWKLIPSTNGSYAIASALNETKVLDLPGGVSLSGTKLQLYSANATAAQNFTINKIEAIPGITNSGTYTITSALASNKVADVAGGSTANRANVQLYTSNGTVAQKFKLTFNGATGYYTITNAGANKVLDVAGAAKTNGTNVHIYQGNNTDAQKWTIVPGSVSGTYVLYAACSGLVLDVAGGSTADRANIQTYSANGTAAQRWVFKAA